MRLGLPFIPLLPDVAATPAGHDQDAFLIGEVEDSIGFHLAFETNGVQMEMLDVAEFIAQALRGLPPEHVGRPAAAADQQRASVDAEEAVLFVGQLRGDLADTEANISGIRDGAVGLKFKMRGIKIRRTHWIRPPQLGIDNFQFGKIIRRERYQFYFGRSKLERLLKMNVHQRCLQRSRYGLIRSLPDIYNERECG